MIERIINVLDSKIIKINLPNFINVVITTISMIILKKFTLAIYPKDKKNIAKVLIDNSQMPPQMD